MHRTQVGGLVALLLLAADVAFAQQELLDEPRQIEQITFSPPTSASIRLTTRIRRTGKIVSISRDKMVVEVGRDNNKVDIPISEIQRVNTLDGEFTYVPANESFERLKIKARRVNYISVQMVETYEPPPEGLPVEGTATANARPPQQGSSTETRPETSADTGHRAEETPATTSNPAIIDPPAPAVASDPPQPQPGETVYFCSNCQGLLPPSIHNGDKCPHCGKTFWNVVPTAATSPLTPNGGGNAGAGAAQYPAVTAVQNGPPAGQTAPAGQTGGAAVVARGTGLADLPIWVKVGFFVGVLAIAWLLLQRR
jgi:hypothetical protein